jgi:hypothetical protein
MHRETRRRDCESGSGGELKPVIELENVENKKAKIEADALGDHVEWR